MRFARVFDPSRQACIAIEEKATPGHAMLLTSRNLPRGAPRPRRRNSTPHSPARPRRAPRLRRTGRRGSSLLSALESLNAVDPRRLSPSSPATLPLPRRSDQTGVPGVCLGHRVFRRPWSFADGDTRSAAIETPGNPICDSVHFSRIGAAMDIRPL